MRAGGRTGVVSPPAEYEADVHDVRMRYSPGEQETEQSSMGAFFAATSKHLEIPTAL